MTVDGDVIKIGRVESMQLRIDDESVTRVHAVIEVAEDGMTLIDLGSERGTFVDGERISKRAIGVGDRIRVGDTEIVVGDGPRLGLRLPTPEVVRATFGDAFRPTDVFGVAALVLHVDGIRREAWSAETELSERLFALYPRGDVPQPEAPSSRRGTYKTIDDAAPTRTQRCSTCIVKPGFSPCSLCLGTGAGSSPDAFSRCIACDGGFVRCETCEGTTRVIACTIRYVNDTLVSARRAIVPAMHRSIRSFVERAIPAESAWSEEHAFDPEPSLVGSAYRGASAVRAADEFHGFFFGDAASACLAARGELTTGLSRFEAKSFAVPILWTVTGERHEAYFFDAGGALQRVAG